MNEMDTRFANQYNIQWFPGHMTKTLRMMEQEIQHVDASLVQLVFNNYGYEIHSNFRG